MSPGSEPDPAADPYQPTSPSPVEQVRARLRHEEWANHHEAVRPPRNRPTFPSGGSVAPAANQRLYSG